MAASVYPEMSFISFEKNMAHPLISTHDPLEVFNSAVPSRQQWRQLQILDYITGLIYIQFYKLLTIQGCLTNNQNCIPVLQKNLVIKLRIIFVMLGVRRTGPAIRSPSYGPGIFNFFEGPYVAKFGP